MLSVGGIVRIAAKAPLHSGEARPVPIAACESCLRRTLAHGELRQRRRRGRGNVPQPTATRRLSDSSCQRSLLRADSFGRLLRRCLTGIQHVDIGWNAANRRRRTTYGEDGSHAR